MSADPAVLEALEATLRTDPGNAAVRLHLAALYLTGGDCGRALKHCEELWKQDPTNVVAYELGAQAADGAGKVALATGLREAAENPPVEPVDISSATGPVPIIDPLQHPAPPLPPRFPAGPPPGTPPAPPAIPVTGSDHGGDFLPVEQPDITLDDVAGMADVKRTLHRSLLAPLQNPELGAAFSKSIRGGLLLWGPPGTGKTLTARALSGSMNASFIHVKLSDVLDMWMGNSEKNVSRMFAQARALAPSILFLDELDALGAKRSRLNANSMRQVVGQLLEELDGFDGGNEQVYVLAATNQPWDVDTALRRPGRFDRTALVLPPDLEARHIIVTKELEGRPTDGCDPAVVAARTETYSGADLTFVVSVAAELALEASTDAGTIKPITQAMLLEALGEVGPSTRDWLRTAADVASFSDDHRMFAPLLDYVHRVGLA